MRHNLARALSLVVIVVVALGLQLEAAFLQELFEERARRRLGEYGTETFYPALGSVLSGVLSGALLGLVVATRQAGKSKVNVLVTVAILVLVPFLAILHYLLWSATGSRML